MAPANTVDFQGSLRASGLDYLFNMSKVGDVHFR